MCWHLHGAVRRISCLFLAGAGIMLLPASHAQAQGSDDPPAIRYARDLTWAALEVQHFSQKNVYNWGRREAIKSLQLRTHEHKLRREWLNVEMRAFHRLAGQIDTELEEVAKARKELRLASLGAARFSNGDDWPTQRGAFIKLLRQVGHTDEAREMLQRDVGELPADRFDNHYFLRIVDAEGTLSEPPATLTDRSLDGRGIEIFRDFRDEWRQASAALKQNQLVGIDQTTRMRGLLAEWDKVRGTIRGIPSMASTSYLERAGLLVETMEQTEGRMRLGDFLQNKGYAFHGKTVGDLMRHILENDLVVVAGTDAHIELGSVTNALVEVADEKSDVLTARLEVLKRQSPSHNSALRQRMTPLLIQANGGGQVSSNPPAPVIQPTKPASKEQAEEK